MMVTAALMAACSTEENGMGANKDAVSISTRVTLGSDPAQMRSDGTPQARTGGTPQTRADGTSAYTSANATLTLCYGSVDSGQKSTFTCAGGSWSTAQPLYWQDLKPAGGTYAFFAVAPEMPGDVHKGEVRKDQSTSSINRGAAGSTRAAGTLTAFEASDLLMAYQTTTKSGTLDLNLKHLLSQLQVKLVSVSGSDGLTAAELASATLTIDGLKTQYSLAYNGTSGNSTSGAGGDATIPSTGHRHRRRCRHRPDALHRRHRRRKEFPLHRPGADAHGRSPHSALHTDHRRHGALLHLHFNGTRDEPHRRRHHAANDYRQPHDGNPRRRQHDGLEHTDNHHRHRRHHHHRQCRHPHRQRTRLQHHEDVEGKRRLHRSKRRQRTGHQGPIGTRQDRSPRRRTPI